MPITAPSVSLMYLTLISQIHVNVKPDIILSQNRKFVCLALKLIPTVTVVMVANVINVI
jgi:hypothetical protein